MGYVFGAVSTSAIGKYHTLYCSKVIGPHAVGYFKINCALVTGHDRSYTGLIDLLAIQQKSLDRALFLYIFIRKVRSNGVRASITIVHIRKFYKM